MKLLPNKTFPHPVLCGETDDYVGRQFQVTRAFSVNDDYAPVLSVDFRISEEKIRDLIGKDKAAYVVEVYCATTFVRRTFHTTKEQAIFQLNKGDLYRRVEINAFIICTQKIGQYSSENFNDEFGERASFDLLPGDVLAAAETEVYYWDTESVKPLRSVFSLVANDVIEKGVFAIDTSEDVVMVRMHPEDKAEFEKARHSVQHKPFRVFAFFSMVTEVLRQMKYSETDGDKDKRWYRSIEHKLRLKGKELSEETGDPFELAQELLGKPLGVALKSLPARG